MEHALDTTVAPPTWVAVTFVLVMVFSFLAMIGFIAYRWKDGLWGAILVSFNLTFAGLITFNYYEGLGQIIAGVAPIGLFYWDSLVFILMFYILFGIFTLITNRISRVIVTFPFALEVGGKLLLLLSVWCFQVFMLISFMVEIGPTAPRPVAGAVDLTAGREGPDLILRHAMSYSSRGALSTLGEPTEFDPENDFDLRHYQRRCALFNLLWETGYSQFSGDAGFL